MSADRPREPGLIPVDFDPFADPRRPVALPLTDAQREIWTAAQMGTDASTAYNQCFPLLMTGRLSIPSLRVALEQLVDRHEALRATFLPSGEGQVVTPSGGLPLTLCDRSHLEPQALEAEVACLLEAEVREPFDLAAGPLARALIVRQSPERHLLIVTAHHLVCDGWSSGILLRELGELYSADRTGISAQLLAAAPYGDHVRRTIEDETSRSASERYWVDKLSGSIPALDLPSDRPRLPRKTYRGNRERARIGPELYAALKRTGARHGCTLYVVLLTAWQTLLARLTGQTDLIVGMPVAAQMGIDAPLVGHFVQMLPLRASIESEKLFSAALGATRGAVLEAHEHQAITLGRLLERLDVSRDESRSPLVAAVFNVDRQGPPISFAGLSVEPQRSPRTAVNFEVGLDIADTGADLAIECDYNADLFDASTIRRWLAAYSLQLEAVAAQPEIRSDRIPIIAEHEREQIRRWGGRSAVFAPYCLHRRFEAQAARTPDAVAVEFEGERVTYEALNVRANQLAHYLRARGIGPDVIVGLALERSLDQVIAVLAILKAGGAYLPLDPAYPVERLAFMLADADPRAVVTSDQVKPRLQGARAALTSLDADAEAIAACPRHNPETSVAPDHLAYVIYTSGSTGTPKGVLVEHRHASRLFAATDESFRFQPSDVWTMFHSLSFDFSVWEMWGALLHGGRLVVVPFWVSRSPEEFHELLCREGVTILNQTPSAFRQLAEVDRGRDNARLALRLVIFGGEALNPAGLRSWIERHGDTTPELVNMYGITETTVHVTLRRLTARDLDGPSASPIGVPLPDLSIALLDRGGELVPVGVGGELCVGGAGVARGYLGHPRLTAERFPPEGVGDHGHRMYRSGDLARWLPDGQLEYLGRLDQQIQVRGFRVEPGEIVAALNEHPSVADSAVVLEPRDDPRLVAYVVARAGTTLAPAVLRTHLQNRLPDYMIPNAFVPLDRLPTTVNGKLDRERLPMPGGVRMNADRVLPRTQPEKRIASVWQEILGGEPPGVTDDFFELGGHSMLAVKIIARLREVFGVDLPMRAIFHARTIAGLAQVVEALSVTAGPPRQPASPDREEFGL